MLTKESIYVILYSIPVYQILFYTVQLVSFRRKNPSKKYLGLLLLSMTTFLVINAMNFLGYKELFSYLYFFYLPVLLSVAPTYFLYILSITRENHDVNKQQRWLLFSPAILILVVNLVFLFNLDETSRRSVTNLSFLKEVGNGGNIPGFLLVIWIGAILLVFAQIAFAIVKVSKIMQTEMELMRKEPTHLAYLEWRWILGISISVIIFLVINAIMEMVAQQEHLGVVVVYNLLMLVSGGMTGFLGMKQDDLLNQVEKISRPLPAEPVVKVKDNIENADKEPLTADFLSKEEADTIHARIIYYLEQEKPYLRSDFSLHEMCSHLNISRRKVSYVMNEILEKNFYGVINEYRIRDARELLNDDQVSQLKIEALGEMVGFQSKSSFNACFKKVTGMTPSEYRALKKG